MKNPVKGSRNQASVKFSHSMWDRDTRKMILFDFPFFEGEHSYTMFTKRS